MPEDFKLFEAARISGTKYAGKFDLLLWVGD